jgi:hypothetical protein
MSRAGALLALALALLATRAAGAGTDAVPAGGRVLPERTATSLSLEMSVKQLMDLHDLSDERRRARFGLPAHCEPMMTAVAPSGAYDGRVLVMITCAPAPGRR